MVFRFALTGFRRLTNRRGAAFLLAVYFASLMLLLLGGVSLQRTVVETRATQVSRDLSQSFWVSDATLDRVMTEFRAGTIQALMAAQPASATPRCIDGNVTDPQFTATGTYRICETQEPALYTLEVLGQIGTSRQLLSAVIDVRDSQYTFKHALYGQEAVTMHRIFSGSVDTSMWPSSSVSVDANGHPTVVTTTLGVASTVTSGKMTVATTATAPPPIVVMTAQGDVATLSTAPSAIVADQQSYISGAIEVEPGADPRTVVFVSGDSTVLGGITKRTTPLADVPRILAPDIITRDFGDRLVLSGSSSSRVLAAGTYTASSLMVSGGATLTTSGPVSLYVTGPIDIRDRARVYGEPEFASYWCNPVQAECISPKNLRIFARPRTSADRVQIRNDAVVGAAIYAPQMPVQLDGYPLIIGGLVGKQVSAGNSYYNVRAAATILYDLDLGRQAIPVSPAEQMANLRLYRLRELALDTGAGDDDTNPAGLPITPPNQGGGSGGGGGWGGGGCQGNGSGYGIW